MSWAGAVLGLDPVEMPLYSLAHGHRFYPLGDDSGEKDYQDLEYGFDVITYLLTWHLSGQERGYCIRPLSVLPSWDISSWAS